MTAVAGRDPRSFANANRRKIARAEPVGPIDWRVVPGDQNGVRPELHFVLQDNSSPGMKPAARGNEDIAADFQVIGKVDSHGSASAIGSRNEGRSKKPRKRRTGRRSGSQPVATVMKWNQRYWRTRIFTLLLLRNHRSLRGRFPIQFS